MKEKEYDFSKITTKELSGIKLSSIYRPCVDCFLCSQCPLDEKDLCLDMSYKQAYKIFKSELDKRLLSNNIKLFRNYFINLFNFKKTNPNSPFTFTKKSDIIKNITKNILKGIEKEVEL